jgi:dihydrofolate reductase
MSRLIYSMNVSLDGFVETPDHSLEWASMDDELHAWWNDQERRAAALLYGRRVYEVMAAYWPTAEADPAATPVMLEFARIWNPKPKIVFSTTLGSVDPTSRLVHGDVGEILAGLKDEFDGELSVAGPTLAAAFIQRGLVDEFRPVVHPVVLGRGTRFLPKLRRPMGLRLVDAHPFESGAVALSYVRT